MIIIQKHCSKPEICHFYPKNGHYSQWTKRKTSGFAVLHSKWVIIVSDFLSVLMNTKTKQKSTWKFIFYGWKYSLKNHPFTKNNHPKWLYTDFDMILIIRFLFIRWLIFLLYTPKNTCPHPLPPILSPPSKNSACSELNVEIETTKKYILHTITIKQFNI